MTQQFFPSLFRRRSQLTGEKLDRCLTDDVDYSNIKRSSDILSQSHPFSNNWNALLFYLQTLERIQSLTTVATPRGRPKVYFSRQVPVAVIVDLQQTTRAPFHPRRRVWSQRLYRTHLLTSIVPLASVLTSFGRPSAAKKTVSAAAADDDDDAHRMITCSKHRAARPQQHVCHINEVCRLNFSW
jgi:hypothetical protein